MFSFAQAISIVRKSIRKGVLYFIRDPADPEVCHPFFDPPFVLVKLRFPFIKDLNVCR